MNYRHAFHAGNFADLAKHAAVLSFLTLMRRDEHPVLVVDTHAGAGFYDLSDAHFARSKEAEAGIKYLLKHDVPESLKPLADYVWSKNKQFGFKDTIGLYPGSPLLITDHLRSVDAYLGCELRDDDYTLLQMRLGAKCTVAKVDGYARAVVAADDLKSLFYLIDPPFELFEDYERIVETLLAVLELRSDARALIWLPLKDLETFDSFVRMMQDVLLDEDRAIVPEILICELRLRSLWSPMKMNGCVLVAINPPKGFEQTILPLANDVVGVFGEKDARVNLWTL